MPPKSSPKAPAAPAPAEDAGHDGPPLDPAVRVGERLENLLDALLLSNDPERRAGAALWRKFVLGRIARLKRQTPQGGAPRRARRPRLAKAA